jgi:hypothetical protein
LPRPLFDRKFADIRQKGSFAGFFPHRRTHFDHREAVPRPERTVVARIVLATTLTA